MSIKRGISQGDYLNLLSQLWQLNYYLDCHEVDRDFECANLACNMEDAVKQLSDAQMREFCDFQKLFYEMPESERRDWHYELTAYMMTKDVYERLRKTLPPDGDEEFRTAD
jgi:hypothetical protein